MTATATMPTVAPTLAEQREQLEAELAQLQRQLHDGVDGALDRGDAAGALRFERRQAPTIKARIAELTTQLAGVDREIADVGRIARETAVAEQQQREEDESAAEKLRIRTEAQALLRAVATVLSRYRVSNIRHARAVAARTGRPELERSVFLRDSLGDFLAAFGDAVANWTAQPPGLQGPDTDLIRRISGPVGDALRLALSAFTENQ